MKPWAIANGDSRRAEQILDQANFNIPARESVLVQSATAKVDEPAFVAAVANVVQTLSQQPNVDEHRLADRAARTPGSCRATATPRSCSSTSRARPTDAQDKIAPILASIDDVQAGNPSLIIEEFGQASADHQIDLRFDARHGPRGGHLGAADDRDPRRRVRRARRRRAAGPARALGRARRDGLNQLVSHVVPTDEQTLAAIILMIGMAVGIDYSLFYLRREREERQRGRIAARGAARAPRGRRARRCSSPARPC